MAVTSRTNNNTIPVRASVDRMMQKNLMFCKNVLIFQILRKNLSFPPKKKVLLYDMADISGCNFLLLPLGAITLRQRQMKLSCRMLFRMLLLKLPIHICRTVSHEQERGHTQSLQQSWPQRRGCIQIYPKNINLGQTFHSLLTFFGSIILCSV